MTDRFLVIRNGRVVADDCGRIIAFSTSASCAAFVCELQQLTGDVVLALSRTSRQIAQLLAMYGLSEAAVLDFEASTTSAKDALAWAVELARRCSGPLRDLGAEA